MHELAKLGRTAGVDRPHNAATIMQAVADNYDVPITELKGRARPARIAWARQVAMYLIRCKTGSTSCAIGQEFGGRDHGTVLWAIKVVRNAMDVYPTVRDEIQTLEAALE